MKPEEIVVGARYRIHTGTVREVIGERFTRSRYRAIRFVQYRIPGDDQVQEILAHTFADRCVERVA